LQLFKIKLLISFFTDDVASLHAKNGERFLAPSSFSYDASASSQLFDSRMFSKSVKNLEDKENTSASKPLDLNNTEMMSNCLSAESMKNLNRQTFLEEQAEEKKKKNGATVMESAAPQAKQGWPCHLFLKYLLNSG